MSQFRNPGALFDQLANVDLKIAQLLDQFALQRLAVGGSRMRTIRLPCVRKISGEALAPYLSPESMIDSAGRFTASDLPSTPGSREDPQIQGAFLSPGQCLRCLSAGCDHHRKLRQFRLQNFLCCSLLLPARIWRRR
jgi:hypothetical protein